MRDACFWQKADVPILSADVRFRGKADMPSRHLDKKGWLVGDPGVERDTHGARRIAT
jgi:hypothetical protein